MDYILQKVLSSFVLHINGICALIKTEDMPLQVIVKNIVYSAVNFFLESYNCMSAREITVINCKNSQVLLNIHSDTPPLSFLPAINLLYRDPLASLYLINQSIEKSSNKYINTLSTVELTFSSIYLGIDLRLLKWSINLMAEISVPHESTTSTESVLVILSKTIIHATKLSILFLQNENPNYLLLSSDSILVLDTYSNKTQLRIKLDYPHIIDLSFESSYHNKIVSPLSPDSALDINYESGKENVLEIRLTHAKITFLYRVIMEFYEYMYKEFAESLSNPNSDPDKTSPKSSLCILITNSQFFIPRNSATLDGFTIKCDSFEIFKDSETFLQKNQKFKHEVAFLEKINEKACFDHVVTENQKK